MNKSNKKALKKSAIGALELAGGVGIIVGAGAIGTAVGSVIGSAVPVVGTAAGAGIGAGVGVAAATPIASILIKDGVKDLKKGLSNFSFFNSGKSSASSSDENIIGNDSVQDQTVRP